MKLQQPSALSSSLSHTLSLTHRDEAKEIKREREGEDGKKLWFDLLPLQLHLKSCSSAGQANISPVVAVGNLLFNPELLLTHLFTWPQVWASSVGGSACANNGQHYVVMLQESAIQIETNCYANLCPSSALSWPLFGFKKGIIQEYYSKPNRYSERMLLYTNVSQGCSIDHHTAPSMTDI